MKYLKENLGWHFRIRIKRSFQFQLEGQWRKVSSVSCSLDRFTSLQRCLLVKQTYPNVYLAFAHDKQSDEDWVIVSDEPLPAPQTLLNIA